MSVMLAPFRNLSRIRTAEQVLTVFRSGAPFQDISDPLSRYIYDVRDFFPFQRIVLVYSRDRRKVNYTIKHSDVRHV